MRKYFNVNEAGVRLKLNGFNVFGVTRYQTNDSRHKVSEARFKAE